LWSCAEVFRSRRAELNLFQVTVSKGGAGTGYPLSHEFLYSTAGVPVRP